MRLLVLGLPRSGTTWLARALTAHPAIRYVHEPDNDRTSPFAALVNESVDHRTFIRPGTRLARYEALWDLAYAGGWPDGTAARWMEARLSDSWIPAPLRAWSSVRYARAVTHAAPSEHVLVKSVNALAGAEWIAHRYRPAMIVVWRHPFNMIASYLERGWGAGGDLVDSVRARFEGTPVWRKASSRPEQLTLNVCARLELLLELGSRHPEWQVLRHEDLTLDPHASFRHVMTSVGIDWDPRIDAFLDASNKPATGEWETNRVASEERGSWRRRLAPDQVADARSVLERFAALPGAVAPWPDLLSEVVHGVRT